MTNHDKHALTRRELLAAATGGVVVALGCGSESDSRPLDAGGEPDSGGASDTGAAIDSAVADGAGPDAGPFDAPPTPACPETESNILGPAYIEGAPVRADGELNVLGWTGTPLTLTGRVVSARDCAPLAFAEIDLWQADDAGCYDGSPIGCVGLSPEWPLRGRVVADAEGNYELTTLYPGLYPGRTRHIHAIIRVAGHRTLTTQIYFAGEAANATDGAILPGLTVPLDVAADGARSGVFDIVLAPA
jgi:protocatechuate 3,4-dioxygenase beta subunit